MVEELTRARLGRGIAALIGDADEDFGRHDRAGGRASAKRVPVEFLRRNPNNPRRSFAEADLAELAASIRERGVIQPIIVRPIRDLPDVFEIIAGERRWRAAQRAELHDVPVVVVEADDKLALELAIVENVQRADLNAIEEASGYGRLIAQHGYSQTDLATTLGKSRSHVANTLRLLKLPERVRDMLSRGEISAGHGRALLTVEDPEAVADRIVEKGLSVRDVERLGQTKNHETDHAPDITVRAPETKSADGLAGSADLRALRDALQTVLGLSVKIDCKGAGGELRIRYSAPEQLDTLCRSLGVALG